MMTPPSSDDAPDGIPAFYQPGPLRSEDGLGYLLSRALKSLRAQADARLGQFDLTHAQWLPLYKLVSDGCGTAADLARDLDVDGGAMTRSLDRLEAKGLLRRERSCADRRVVNLILTPEGREAASHVPAVLADVFNAHLRGFSEAEWRQLCDLLRRVLANGEAMRQGNDGHV